MKWELAEKYVAHSVKPDLPLVNSGKHLGVGSWLPSPLVKDIFALVHTTSPFCCHLFCIQNQRCTTTNATFQLWLLKDSIHFSSCHSYWCGGKEGYQE